MYNSGCDSLLLSLLLAVTSTTVNDACETELSTDSQEVDSHFLPLFTNLVLILGYLFVDIFTCLWHSVFECCILRMTSLFADISTLCYRKFGLVKGIVLKASFLTCL